MTPCWNAFWDYRASSPAFAILACLIAAVGLYGTLARSVSDRRREIGLRLALGARPSDVFRLVFGQGGCLLLAGIAARVDPMVVLRE
ncbi:MAG TPA: FtsX-like permease family protein [Vicinamibacterales bacterium]|nr:FtsX-like permease family protein [Vicinamibacterales bacterium]